MANSMQDDAMRRVAQMYSNTHPVKNNTPPVVHSNNLQPEGTKAQPSEQNKKENSESDSRNFLEIFMQDKEKSLIVLLIVILLSEKADASVILALMYLII